MRDLPVALSLPSPLREEVAAYVETEAGWQVVGLAGPPQPVLVVACEPMPGCDCVVVVEGGPDPEQVRRALGGGALDVVAWPAERSRLLEAPLRIRAAAPAAGAPLLRVAGVRGGVGTSTVALALGGLAAWAGRRVLVVGGDDLLELCGAGPWQGPGAAEIDGLRGDEAGREVAALARPLGAVPGLAVLGGGPHVDSAADWPADLVVVDAGTDLLPAPQLVCARAGPGIGRAAGSRAPVAVVGDGPLDAARLRSVLGPALAGRLPWSARVARAGALGRVPAALPGTWLRAVRQLAARVAPPGGLSTGRQGRSATRDGARPTVGRSRPSRRR